MNDIELLKLLLPEEYEALGQYKDFSDPLNDALRQATLSADLSRRCDVLDAALKKGRSTKVLTLYRATCAHYITASIGVDFKDPAFVSTSLNSEGLIGFYCSESPAKLVINYPACLPLACFPCDSGGGEENERLLPRGIRFRVLDRTVVEDRAEILRQQGTSSDRGELYLKSSAKLHIIHLGVI